MRYYDFLSSLDVDYTIQLKQIQVKVVSDYKPNG